MYVITNKQAEIKETETRGLHWFGLIDFNMSLYLGLPILATRLCAWWMCVRRFDIYFISDVPPLGKLPSVSPSSSSGFSNGSEKTVSWTTGDIVSSFLSGGIGELVWEEEPFCGKRKTKRCTFSFLLCTWSEINRSCLYTLKPHCIVFIFFHNVLMPSTFHTWKYRLGWGGTIGGFFTVSSTGKQIIGFGKLSVNSSLTSQI